MRARILAFVQALRDHGVDVSVAESLDAAAAVAVAGVERDVLREALALTLIKDEGDRPTFDRLFEAMFPALGAVPDRLGRRRGRGARGGTSAGAGAGRGDGHGERRTTVRRDEPRPGRPAPADTRRRDDGAPRVPVRRATSAEMPTARGARRRILTLPFRDYTALDLEEAHVVARELAAQLRGRLARRTARARRGRLDFRRTMRAAVSTGGTPAHLRFRAPRPARPDLVVLCDLSRSVAEASGLLLALLAPVGRYFRRVDLFAYVDHLCPVSLERGHVIPDGPLDLHARSDLGRVLHELWEQQRARLNRSTLLLVLGDARNNRLPPRADALRAARDRVQRLVWLVPEARERWNTGDSVLALYAPSCDAVLECVALGALVGAVRRAL